MLVDNGGTSVAPIIVESNPTWVNLFGRIERRAYLGAYFSDHTMLKPGSIHHANGGYLVLNARDLLTSLACGRDSSGRSGTERSGWKTQLCSSGLWPLRGCGPSQCHGTRK